MLAMNYEANRDGNRPLRVLTLAADPALAAQTEAMLQSIGCFARSAADAHGLGRALSEATPDVFLVRSAPADFTAKRVIPMLREQAPRAVLLLALDDAEEAAALAEIFAGYALPLPLSAALLGDVLAEKIPKSRLQVRRTQRWRVYAPATLNVAGVDRQAVMLNFSAGGAMVLATADADAGALVAFRFEHAGRTRAFAGTVKHVYAGTPDEAGEYQALAGAHPQLFGIEFIEASRAGAEAFCAELAAAPPVFPFQVFCVPGIPRGLAQVFEHYGISVAVATELPAEFAVPPTLLIVDLAACSHEELRRLNRTAARSILVGVTTKPLVDPERVKIASALPAVFVLPHQSAGLAETVDRFFRPIHRKHPRIDAGFDLVLRNADGKNLAGEGLNLSLSGCAALLDAPAAPKTHVTGSISPAGAHEVFRFHGEIAYCVEDRSRFRTGIDFHIDEPHRQAFHAYLAGVLQKDLQRRWLAEFA